MVNMPHSLWAAKVFHKRLSPKENTFRYNIFYVLINMSELDTSLTHLLSRHKISLLRYADKDHGWRDGQPALEWAKQIFLDRDIVVDSVFLLTLPRMFGFFFCPVSFWLGFEKEKLVSVICEVNNTFHQTHSYICYMKNKEDITPSVIFKANKTFHVSPFYPSDGEYEFRFDISPNKDQWRVYIHYYQDKKLQLITSMVGKIRKMSFLSVLAQFIRAPFVTFKVIFLIYYQAVKLFFKKTTFYILPVQHNVKLTDATIINKD